MVQLGKYQHYKGNVYEVTGCSDFCTGVVFIPLVHYRSPDHVMSWTRTEKDFLTLVDGVPRFKLIEPLNNADELLIETIKLNKQIWDQCKESDPAWMVNGSGKALLYLVGDKISFALSVRLITRERAEELLNMVKEWN